MSCRECGSARQTSRPAEVNVHPPNGLEHLDTPIVLAFPQMLICLDCGFAECVLSEAELRDVARSNSVNGDADRTETRRTQTLRLRNVCGENSN